MYTKDRPQRAHQTARQGFTIIEILVVMSIIALLSGMILASLGPARARARYAKMKATFEQIAVAAQVFNQNEQFYPCDVPPNQDPIRTYASPEINKYCNPKGLVQTGLLPKWPQGPCPGWEYDWENWTSLVALPTGNPQSQVVRITLRKDPGAGWPATHYFCIKDTHGSTVNACGGKAGDHGYTLGGARVNYTKGGTLYCS